MIVSETDAKGMITYANDDFCLVAGYTKRGINWKPHNIVRHIDMPKVALKIYGKLSILEKFGME